MMFAPSISPITHCRVPVAMDSRPSTFHIIVEECPECSVGLSRWGV
jgi:hypothetical protein